MPAGRGFSPNPPPCIHHNWRQRTSAGGFAFLLLQYPNVILLDSFLMLLGTVPKPLSMITASEGDNFDHLKKVYAAYEHSIIVQGRSYTR